MLEELTKEIARICAEALGQDVAPELSRPAEQFGDYSTNVALVLGKKLGQAAQEVASKIKSELEKYPLVASVDIASPGFINIRLNSEALAQAVQAATSLDQPLKGQQILVEFGDPNPFKEMHIGHLYSYIVGDALSNLLSSGGAEVKRLSYHGDVGRQVAQAIWGMRGSHVTSDVSLGKAYALGAQAYESDEQAKQEIEAINQHVYAQDDEEINQLHEHGVKLSFEYFDKILNLLSISTDKRYLESQTTPVGLKLVEENTGKVFSQSDGAIVYKGEKVGLHTRVFITSGGLPTYETKDLGLVQLKDQDFPKTSQSIVVTASEQAEYFKVMLAALAEINPELASKTKHISHGFLSLATGKMSSRSGSVYSAAQLVDDVSAKAHRLFSGSAASMPVAAIKYGLLKQHLGPDIVFDEAESINIEGNSGPYLQYAHARVASILAKATKTPEVSQGFDDNERSLALKISEFPEVVAKARGELMPSHVCSYLFELSQAFNRFYEHSRVLNDPRETTRLGLIKAYKDVLKKGLDILGIEAPEKV